MKLYIGSDHAGFKLKEELIKYFNKNQIDFKDLGNLKYDKDDDYPDFSYKVAKKVASDKNSLGILICRSSAGVCIAANKIKGIRAVSAINLENVKKTRQQNDANILCLSGRDTSMDNAIQFINAFIETNFTSETRHVRRIQKIKDIENKNE